MTDHNWIPFYSILHWLDLGHGSIQIAHHDKSVSIGETILWGESLEEASYYAVVSVSGPVDLQDLWICECRIIKPKLFVLGEPINCQARSSPQRFGSRGFFFVALSIAFAAAPAPNNLSKREALASGSCISQSIWA